MDSRQEIGLGGAAASYNYVSAPRAETPVETPQAVTTSSSGGSADTEQRDQRQQAMNPRTVLDPDLFVNVAEYSFGNGNIEFQVPSKSQLEAYRRGQDAEAAENDAQRRESQQRVTEIAENGDGDGVGGGETQAVGTVAAAAVSQSGAADPAPNKGASQQRPSGTPEARRVVKLEA